MSLFVAVDNIDKVFPLSSGGEYVALKGIDLQIKKGEFISLIGHSGCWFRFAHGRSGDFARSKH